MDGGTKESGECVRRTQAGCSIRRDPIPHPNKNRLQWTHLKCGQLTGQRPNSLITGSWGWIPENCIYFHTVGICEGVDRQHPFLFLGQPTTFLVPAARGEERPGRLWDPRTASVPGREAVCWIGWIQFNLLYTDSLLRRCSRLVLKTLASLFHAF